MRTNAHVETYYVCGRDGVRLAVSSERPFRCSSDSLPDSAEKDVMNKRPMSALLSARSELGYQSLHNPCSCLLWALSPVSAPGPSGKPASIRTTAFWGTMQSAFFAQLLFPTNTIYGHCGERKHVSRRSAVYLGLAAGFTPIQKSDGLSEVQNTSLSSSPTPTSHQPRPRHPTSTQRRRRPQHRPQHRLQH